uniref:Uncharacterized protein n=1 Tax=Arundo donax TaxID=35708 RepID=A0A0A9JMB8_ARUDO
MLHLSNQQQNLEERDKSDHQCVVDCFVVVNFNVQRCCI